MRRLLVPLLVLVFTGVIAPQSANAFTSTPEARQQTLKYAENDCSSHGRCEFYDATACLRHDGGVSCRAWVYYRNRQGKKFECGRLVWWKRVGGGYNRDFLGGWKCYWGWS